MSPNQFFLLYVVLFGASRIRGCIRRWRQPLLRGREWFFSVGVQPDFYEGHGRKMLQRYRMRMFIPFVLDIPVAAALITGHLLLLALLIVAQAALIHINHVFSVDLAERQARAFAGAEAEQPVAAMVLSLKPRRMRDYTNGKLESALALSTVFAFALLVRYYLAAPDHHNLREVFGPPAFWVYAQFGLLFVKRVVVAWRAPVPQDHVDEYLAAREETRKYYIKVCDWSRILIAARVLSWPFLLSTSAANVGRVASIWSVAWLALAVALTIWTEIKRKKLLTVTLRARPVKLPDFLNQAETTAWPLCYQPSVPMLVLKGTRGYSLNLANTLNQLGAAYIAGLVALVVVLLRLRQ